jgi:hypothetical protein
MMLFDLPKTKLNAYRHQGMPLPNHDLVPMMGMTGFSI